MDMVEPKACMLETKRLRLEVPGAEDFAVFKSVSSDERVMRYISPDGRAFSDAEIKRIHGAVQAHHRENGFGPCIVRKKSDGTVIGLAGLKHLAETPYIDLGFSFFETYWRNGFGFEVASDLIHFGFDRLNLKSIAAVCSSENTASKKLLKKIGMTFEKPFFHRGMKSELYFIHKT
jgi:ribosomal-protein-alanine N-acetyltransferase